MDNHLLTAARTNGYLDLDFTGCTDDRSATVCEMLKISEEWANECIGNRRHVIHVGHHNNEHFLMWSRKKGREYKYVMVQIWNAFRTVAEEPSWNTDRLSIWALVKTRDQAVRAAEILVAIDRTPRNPALELGVAKEHESPPIEA
jgi:hypothetical protein